MEAINSYKYIKINLIHNSNCNYSIDKRINLCWKSYYKLESICNWADLCYMLSCLHGKKYRCWWPLQKWIILEHGSLKFLETRDNEVYEFYHRPFIDLQTREDNFWTDKYLFVSSLPWSSPSLFFMNPRLKFWCYKFTCFRFRCCGYMTPYSLCVNAKIEQLSKLFLFFWNF